jgi:superfamily II DNA or RNA helicase
MRSIRVRCKLLPFALLVAMTPLFSAQAASNTISSRSTVSVSKQVFSKELCSRALKQITSEKGRLQNLPEPIRDYLSEVILPTTGLRTLYKDKGEWRTCKASATSLCFSGFVDSSDIRIEWKRAVDEPYVEIGDGIRTLILPDRYNWKADIEGERNRFRRFLVGHPLHPYLPWKPAQVEREKLGEPQIVRKAVQLGGIQAANESIRRFENGDRTQNKFLFVAPTGTGKTEPIIAVLKDQITHAKHKLHILVADQSSLVRQLEDDAKTLQKELKVIGQKVKIIKWGDGMSASSAEELLTTVERSDIPVLLVTTTKSLRDRFNQADVQDPIWARARNLLATFIYDEAHHTGAEEAGRLISNLIDHPESQAFLYGTTATPVHLERDIQKIFNNRAFWAYRDTAEDYKKGDRKFGRTFKEIMDQLSSAIEAGELTPINKIHFLDPEQLIKAKNFFIGDSEKGRYSINPIYFDALLDALAPLFHKDGRGFFSIGSVNEADQLTKKAQKKYPTKRIERLHYNMPAKEQDEVLRDFKEGRIDFLVTIRQMDEGVNIPDLTTYIDLNRSVGPRPLLQRLGRILRLYPGKEGVDVVSLMGMDEAQLRESLMVVHELVTGKMRVPPRIGEALAKKAKNDLPSGISGDSAFVDEVRYQESLIALETKLKDFFQKKARGAAAAARDLNELASELRRDSKELSTQIPKDLRIKILKYKDTEEFDDVLTADARVLLSNWSKHDDLIEAAANFNAYVKDQLVAGGNAGLPIILPDRLIDHLGNGLPLSPDEQKVLELQDGIIRYFEKPGFRAWLSPEARDLLSDRESLMDLHISHIALKWRDNSPGSYSMRLSNANYRRTFVPLFRIYASAVSTEDLKNEDKFVGHLADLEKRGTLNYKEGSSFNDGPNFWRLYREFLSSEGLTLAMRRPDRVAEWWKENGFDEKEPNSWELAEAYVRAPFFDELERDFYDKRVYSSTHYPQNGSPFSKLFYLKRTHVLAAGLNRWAEMLDSEGHALIYPHGPSGSFGKMLGKKYSSAFDGNTYQFLISADQDAELLSHLSSGAKQIYLAGSVLRGKPILEFFHYLKNYKENNFPPKDRGSSWDPKAMFWTGHQRGIEALNMYIATLEKLGLPTALPPYGELRQFYEAIKKDDKLQKGISIKVKKLIQDSKNTPNKAPKIYSEEEWKRDRSRDAD